MRELRMQLAEQDQIPPYIVLSDKVLHQLSLTRPTTLDEFGTINGITEHKKKKYGKAFVNLIKQYV